MMLTRRRLLYQFSGLASLALSGCKFKLWKPEQKLRVGEVAHQESLLFEQIGLKPEQLHIDFINFSGGNLIIEALNAGAVDVGGISEIPAAYAIAAKANLKVIAALRGDINTQILLLPKGSPVKQFSDLRGKRIGYVKGTTSHYILLVLLARNRMTLNDIDAINLSPADGQSAFSTGTLDGWIIYGYPGLIAASRYGARTLLNAQGILTGDYLIAARKDLLSKPEIHRSIEQYLIQARKAFQWRNEHHGEYAESYSKVIGVPAGIVRQSVDAESQPQQLAPVTPKIIDDTAQIERVFAQAGILPPVTDFASSFDTSFNPVLGA